MLLESNSMFCLYPGQLYHVQHVAVISGLQLRCDTNRWKSGTVSDSQQHWWVWISLHLRLWEHSICSKLWPTSQLAQCDPLIVPIKTKQIMTCLITIVFFFLGWRWMKWSYLMEYHALWSSICRKYRPVLRHPETTVWSFFEQHSVWTCHHHSALIFA